MGVTVVIASYNQLSSLPLVLQSFSCQTKNPERVVIADDGSCDGTCEWLDALPDDAYSFPIHYTTGRHNGYGLTISENRAAKMVPQGRLLFTNADVIHSPCSVEAHDSMAENVLAGGEIVELGHPWSERIPACLLENFGMFERFCKGRQTNLSNKGYLERDPKLNFYGIWGGNFSIDVMRFMTIGGFNMEYHGMYGGEESDLMQRFFSVGGEPQWVYNSTAYHLGHKPKKYKNSAPGNSKYQKEYMRANLTAEDRRGYIAANRKRLQSLCV